MADNEQNNNDEYLFGDLDAVQPESTDTPVEENVSKTYSLPSTEGQNNIRRNAFIVVSVVILAIIIYNLVSNKKPYSSNKPSPKAHQAFQQPQQSQNNVAAINVPVQPISTTPVVEVDNSQVNTKLSAVESSQQSIQSQVGAMNNQVLSVSTSVSTIMDKMSELNQVMLQLSQKVDEQSLIIEKLMQRSKPKVIHIKHVKMGQQLPKYYVQAVIPGRAWLIATNGTTLTVREGTLIRGYGMVKLIDPTQGRVMTSSGQVIRFNQDDS